MFQSGAISFKIIWLAEWLGKLTRPHSFPGALGLIMRERVYHKLTKSVVSFHRPAKVRLSLLCSGIPVP
jgi:hypothetical protein